MEDCKKEIIHIVFAKFKEEVTEEEKEECIKRAANLVDLVPALKSFKWGKELAIATFQLEFTHIFESSFESAEGVAEYISHPRHVEFANFFLPKLEKFAIVDYENSKVPLSTSYKGVPSYT